MLIMRIIETLETESASLPVLVRKNDGTPHMCLDCQNRNVETIADL